MDQPILHQRLRAATASTHEALERELDWKARVATLAGYRDMLARLHGFHAAWEPAIGAALADGDFFDARRRLSALREDLAYLGLSEAGIGALPLAKVIALSGPAPAMGALYVLEGSTLGGRVIGKHIASAHGLMDGDSPIIPATASARAPCGRPSAPGSIRSMPRATKSWRRRTRRSTPCGNG
ncbi:biliverdin-producing heme oxygenase [Methylobacterium komagatae]